MNIAELRRLAAEATPGPWEATSGKSSGMVVIAPNEPKVRINVSACGGMNREPNAALIVAMRNALPELLKALEWQTIETAPSIPKTYRTSGICADDDKLVWFLDGSATHWRPLPLPPHGGVDVG